jgi:hypothetical protein
MQVVGYVKNLVLKCMIIVEIKQGKKKDLRNDVST